MARWAGREYSRYKIFTTELAHLMGATRLTLSTKHRPRPVTNAGVDIVDHPLFEGADAASLAAALRGVSAHEVPAGQIVARPDTQTCLLVFEGSLLSYVLLPDGRRILFEVVRPGGVDGLLSVAVGVEGHFSEAAERSLVARLDRPVLEALMDKEPLIARNLIRMSLNRLRRREAQLEAVIHHEATRRVAAMLLTLTRYTGRPAQDGSGPLVELSPRPTHQLLADMVGLRRETVTIEMGRLRRLGAVRVRSKALILDRQLLADAVENEIPKQIHTLLDAGDRSSARGR